MTRTPLAPANPAVLRWAREDAGLSREDVGRLAGVEAQRVQAWESGLSQPTLGQLRRVADSLRRTVAFFFSAAPPVDHTPTPPDFRSIAGAMTPGLRRELRFAIERRDAYLELAGEDRAAQRWRAWTDEPARDPETVRRRLDVLTDRIEATRDTLAALKIWVGAVEAQGVLVFQMSRVAVAECRGFSIDHPVLPVIVLNGADSAAARAFTLMHELGHLLDRTGGLCLLEDRREVEHRCNRFAADVLMPPSDVRRLVGATGDAEAIDRVARAFRVSALAAAIRLNDLRLIARNLVDDVIRQSEEAAARASAAPSRGGPAPEVLKRRNLGEPYVGAVLDALHRDEITVLDATNLLDTKLSVLEKLERAGVGVGA